MASERRPRPLRRYLEQHPPATPGALACARALRRVRTRRPRRLAARLFVVILALTAAGAGSALAAAESNQLATDIAPQPLAHALALLAAQTGLQIVYESQVAAAQRSGGAPAGLSAAAALGRVLEGTGLRFEFLNARTVRILAAVRTTRRPAPLSPSGAGGPPHAEAAVLPEAIITANRRAEMLRRTPISLAAWNHEALDGFGAISFADVAAHTPGVENDYFADLGPATHTNLAIRGINARDGTATGVYLDDTPIRPDPVGSIGRATPYPLDLERIEVLRGPQGTLLGEGAEGGAIRFISRAPSLTDFSGYARAEFASTARGAPSWETVAAAGGPLRERTLGYRISAAYRSSGGYVDRVDPFSGALVDHDVNSAVAEAVRLALTFEPGPALSITPSISYQSERAHDGPSFYTALSDPGAGVLRSGKLLSQPTTDTFVLASLRLVATLPAATLTSITSYSHRSVVGRVDATNNALKWGNPLGPEYPASDATHLGTEILVRQLAVTQDLRVAAADPSARFGWDVGVFILHARYFDGGRAGPAFNAEGTDVGDSEGSTDGSETQLAIFGDLTFRPNARWSASVGGRATASSYAATYRFVAPGTRVVVPLQGSESPAARRAALGYQVDEDTFLYATASTGYRLGGLNPPIQAWCPLPFPQAYGPDEVVGYELGAKARVLGGRAEFDASVFHMRWSHVQLDIPVPLCFPYTINAGGGISNGFETALESLLNDRWKLRFAAAYVHAYYPDTIVSGGYTRVGAGDAIGSLPIVPAPWTVTATADYHFPVGERLTGRIVLDQVFRSRNPGPFYSRDPSSLSYDPSKRPDPSTNLLDLRAVLEGPRMELRLFVDNLLDSQPTILRRNVYTQSTLFVASTFRPRTIGLSCTRRY